MRYDDTSDSSQNPKHGQCQELARHACWEWKMGYLQPSAQGTIWKRRQRKYCKSQRDCMIPAKSVFQMPQHWHTYEVTETLEAFIGPARVQISLTYGPSRLIFHSSLISFLGTASYQTKHSIPKKSSNCSPWYLPKKFKIIYSRKNPWTHLS